MSERDSDERFTFDIRRTLILGPCIGHWGLPEFRLISKHPERHAPVEVYSFPPQKDAKVHRFITVGVSSNAKEDGTPLNYELFMALPPSLGGASGQQVMHFILDVFAYGLRPDVSLGQGYVIPEASVMPSCWRPRAVLLDEPLSEPEELTCFHVGQQHVDVLWAAPIYQVEAELIDHCGLNDFDRMRQATGWSLADPTRPPAVPPTSS